MWKRITILFYFLDVSFAKEVSLFRFEFMVLFSSTFNHMQKSESINKTYVRNSGFFYILRKH